MPSVRCTGYCEAMAILSSALTGAKTRILDDLDTPTSVLSGAVTTALMTGLSLVDARTLTPRTRPLSRVASAAASAWWIWNSAPNDIRFPGTGERLAYSAAAFGLSLGAAPLEEWFDARVRNTLEPVLGKTGTRVAIAGSAAALAAGAWWADRRLSTANFAQPVELDDTPVPLPDNVTAILETMLEATPDFDTQALTEQLTAASTLAWALDPEHSDPAYLPLIVADEAPRATPWHFTLPVYARFTADTPQGPQDIYITLEIADGQLRSTGMLDPEEVLGTPGSPSPYALSDDTDTAEEADSRGAASTAFGFVAGAADPHLEVNESGAPSDGEDAFPGGIDWSAVSWPGPADITLMRQSATGVVEI